jgi:hypothetical protein
MSRVAGTFVIAPLAVVVGAGLFGGCSDETRAPGRPLQVPRTAAWGRGGDGAQPAWIDCWRRADAAQARDQQPPAEPDDRFDCEVFDERGAVQQKGPFRLLDVSPDGTLTAAKAPRALLSFRGRRGLRIDAGPGRVLVQERLLSCTADRCVERGP